MTSQRNEDKRNHAAEYYGKQYSRRLKWVLNSLGPVELQLSASFDGLETLPRTLRE